MSIKERINQEEYGTSGNMSKIIINGTELCDILDLLEFPSYQDRKMTDLAQYTQNNISEGIRFDAI